MLFAFRPVSQANASSGSRVEQAFDVYGLSIQIPDGIQDFIDAEQVHIWRAVIPSGVAKRDLSLTILAGRKHRLDV